jgi:hypothetical protein
MVLLVLATAPAVLCASYMAQNTQAHSCCPPPTAPENTAAPTCCIHSPAVTSHGIEIPAPSVASAAVAVDLLVIIARVETATIADLDTSPPHCSSILRI